MSKIFVRYPSGTKMSINRNIFLDIPKILKLFGHPEKRAEYIQYKQIHGNTYVDQNSTWVQTAIELLDHVEKNTTNASAIYKVIQKILRQLKKLPDSQNPHEIWSKIRKIVVDNAEVLDPWRPRSWSRDVQRDKNGDYFFIDEEGNKCNIIGQKTLNEEKLDSFVSSAVQSFGVINAIIRFVALFFISNDYKKNKKQYRQNWVCYMPEQKTDTSFLHWRWSLSNVLTERKISWRPYTTLCDPDWMASELISAYTKKIGIDFDIQLKPEDSAESNFNKYFKGYKYQIEIVLDSNILFGPENTEEYFSYKSITVRWINGNENMFPMMIVPVKSMDKRDEIMNVVREFITQLVIEHGRKIQMLYTGGGRARFAPIIHASTRKNVIISTPSFKPLKLSSRKRKKAGALYKESINTDNIYIEFTHLFNIVLMSADPTEKRGKEGIEKIERWFKKHPNLLKGSEYSALLPYMGTRNLPEFLKKAGRDSVAHVVERLDRSGDLTVLPDDSSDLKKFQVLTAFMRKCAAEALKEVIPR